jgi:hypothetical protein
VGSMEARYKFVVRMQEAKSDENFFGRSWETHKFVSRVGRSWED